MATAYQRAGGYALQKNGTLPKTDLREFEQRAALRFEQVERRIDTMTNRLVAAIVVALTLLFGALHL